MKKFLPLLFIVHFSLFISPAVGQKEGQTLTDSLLGILKASSEDTSKVNLLSDLSKQYYQISDYTNSRKYADEALALSEKIDFKKGKAGSLNQIGNINYFQGNYSEALLKYFASLRIREEIGDKKGIADSHNRIGLVYFDQGNYPDALKEYFASMKISEEIVDKPRIARSNNNIGNIFYSQGNYPEALKEYYASLKIYEEIGEKKGIAASRNNIATTYFAQGKYPEALKEHLASLKIKEEIGDKNGIAITRNNIGNIYVKEGNYPEALKEYYASLKIYEEIGSKYGIAISRSNIGVIYQNEAKYPEALNEHFASLKIREEVGDKNGIAISYLNIGDTKVEMHNARQGKMWLEKALGLSKEIGAKEITRDAFNQLAKADSALGDFKGAFENHKLYIIYRDSLDNEETTKKSLQEKMQYEFDKKETANRAAADLELKKQKLLRNGFIGGFAVVLFFAFVFLRQRNKTIKEKRRAEEETKRAEEEKQRSEELLLNILPEEIARELETTGTSKAKAFTMVTVMFTDFKDFTLVSEKVSAELLVEEIHHCFSAFDSILGKYRIEKIKTIGDAYMCASGLPVSNYTHAVDMIRCAFEIRDFILERKKEKEARGEIPFELRIGIHTGPVVAGIVGIKKYAYDIWGDTVNLASRMEQNSAAGKINISGTTYELVKDKFRCEHRGKIATKNKGEIEMYFVESPVHE
jgi:adenylate cyclase